MNLKFKISFGGTKKGLTEKAEDSTKRHWKILLSLFAVVLVFLGWYFFSLFRQVSNPKPLLTEIDGQIVTFGKEELDNVILYYQDQEKKFEAQKTEASGIKDPTL